MGYTQRGRLEDFGRTDLLLEAQQRTVKRVGDLLLQRTRAGTPVAKPPANVPLDEWIKARHGRLPGTLRESWQVGEVEVDLDGTTMTIPVYTNDSIAPYVEYPTLPHLIVPRNPGGMLRFWNALGETVYATVVHHTGTKGSFMLTTALAEVAVMWQEIGRDELDRWSREQQASIHA
jgi:hypothetical protein